MHRRSLLRRAVDVDGAAVQFGDLFANGESQAGATKPSRPRRGRPVQVEDHSFWAGPNVETVVPYGIYDMAANTGRQDYATRAVEEYKLALNADPTSPFLNNGLARTGSER